MTEEMKETLWTRCMGSDVDQRNQRRLVWATLIWALAFVGVSLLIKREMLSPGPIAWALGAVPLVLGVGVIAVFARYLRQADELQRLIQLEALALGFGGGLFAFLSYRVFERLGAPRLALDDATMVMVVLYLLGIFIGWRRYR